MTYPSNRRVTLNCNSPRYRTLLMRALPLVRAPLVIATLLVAPFAALPAAADQLSTQELKQQCQPLMEGSQSLMAAFQSGQCSSYILGIYDLVSRQCPQLELNRDEAVRSTLDHLKALPDDRTPAVQAIDQFLSARGRCLPVASL